MELGYHNAAMGRTSRILGYITSGYVYVRGDVNNTNTNAEIIIAVYCVT
jgi:hypothetical protein